MANAKRNNFLAILLVSISIIFVLVFAIAVVIQTQGDVYAELNNESQEVPHTLSEAGSPDDNAMDAYLLGAPQGMAGWVITLIVIGSLFGLLGICYCLLFFVLNKYIVDNGKVLRAFRVGTNEGQIHLITYKFSMEYRIPEEVYETKQKAEEESAKKASLVQFNH